MLVVIDIQAAPTSQQLLYISIKVPLDANKDMLIVS